MKKYIILIFLFFIYCNSFCTNLDIAVSLRSSNANTRFDYLYELGFKNKYSEIEIQHERERGKTYNNFDVIFHQFYKQFILSEQYRNISAIDERFFKLDIRYCLGGFRAGASMYGGQNFPSVVVGYENTGDTKNIPIIGKFLVFFVPISYELKSEILTNNFSKFNHEEKVVVRASLSSLINLYLKSTLRDYSKLRWQFKVGVGVYIP